MSRDLFADTMRPRPAPKRSKWMLVGSFFAHVGVVGALLIVPIVSALDNFVLHANDVLSFTVPATTLPPAPPAPHPRTARPIAPDINVRAAPLFPSEKPVTSEVTPPGSGADLGPPGALPSGGGAPATAVLQGSRSVTLAPPPTPAGPIRPGGVIKVPERIAYTAPTYPIIAKAAQIEGTVILEATIDETGVVRDVRVLRSIPLLDGAAIDAVTQWRYTPTRLNGVAVPIIMTVTVTFRLR